MYKKLKDLANDKIVRGSFILFVMIGIFNVLNYIFQMSMAKMLGPADYSILAVLMSLVYILSIPSEAIQTVITRYVSKFNIKHENGKIKDLIYKSFSKGLKFSVAIFIGLILISIFLASLLKVRFSLLVFTGLLIFYMFSVPILRGVLQGKKKFFTLGINMVVESLAKVIFSIILVFVGFSVFGAIGGLIIGGIIAFTLGFWTIGEILISKRKPVEEMGGVYRYNLPVLIGITAIVLIYSLDVILARIFFSPEVAGQYSFVSLIGKVIVFSSFAISKSMFPISSENFEKGKKTRGILKKSLIIISLVSFAMLVLCLLIPEQVIKFISFGSSQYLGASNVLFIVSLAFSFTSFTNILVTYSLSINKLRKSSLYLLFFVLLEVILLSVFNADLVQFTAALLAVNFLMFLYSLFLIKCRR